VIVAVVDYRAGNLTSVVKALAAAGATTRVVARSAGLAGAQAIVVPGVGHFAATTALDREDRRVISGCVQAGVPLLGICLGMQWLFEGSDEAPDLPGLGVFAGRCTKMTSGVVSVPNGNPSFQTQLQFPLGTETTPEVIKIPHVGWNTLEATGRPSRILDGLPAGVTAYFTHSYAAPDGEGTVARTTHGVTFASVVERQDERGSVFGAQFHPEKSGAAGIHMLRRFLEVAREADVRC
jgi:glutamine amidotransferase